MKNKKPFGITALIIIWISVFVLMLTLFLLSEYTEWGISPSTYYIVNIVVVFSSFIATSFFSYAVFKHNSIMRQQNDEIRRQTNSAAQKDEAFKNMQFAASNYSIVDFVDTMSIFPESTRYIEKTITKGMFMFDLILKDTSATDILQNSDNYQFLTVKLPLKLIEGKSLGRLQIHKLSFEKNKETYSFVPTSVSAMNALLLYNETEHRNEAVFNIIAPKESDFFTIGELNEFYKIKIVLGMESLLGVVINGTNELYFTNPEKAYKSNISTYKINSSQFEISGLPHLTNHKHN